MLGPELGLNTPLSDVRVNVERFDAVTSGASVVGFGQTVK